MLKEHGAGKKGAISDVHAEVIRERFARVAKESKESKQPGFKPREKPKEFAPKAAPTKFAHDDLTPGEYAQKHGISHKDASEHLGKLHKKGFVLKGSRGDSYHVPHDAPKDNNITSKEYADIHGISESKASDHLRDLYEKGKIKAGEISGHYRIPYRRDAAHAAPAAPPKAPPKPAPKPESRPKPAPEPVEPAPKPAPTKPGGVKVGGPVPKPSVKHTPVKPGAKPSEHTDHEPGHVGKLNTSLIDADPRRFQYKHTAEASGSVGSLAGVQKYDENLGGIIQVWKDPGDGKTYVVNGHNRLDLAKKLGAKDVTVRFLDAGSAKEARSIGALTNIAEGRGTAVDAAKYFRDTGFGKKELEDRGVPMREKIADDGLALSKLDDSLFDKVSFHRDRCRSNARRSSAAPISRMLSNSNT